MAKTVTLPDGAKVSISNDHSKFIGGEYNYGTRREVQYWKCTVVLSRGGMYLQSSADASTPKAAYDEAVKEFMLAFKSPPIAALTAKGGENDEG